MARRRHPILAGIGGGLEGLARALAQQTAQSEVRRRQATQMQFDATKQQGSELQTMIDKIRQDPSGADTLLEGAKANPFLNGTMTGTGINLSRFKPTNSDLLGKDIAGISSAKTVNDIPTDISSLAASRGVKPEPMPTPDPQMAPFMAGGQDQVGQNPQEVINLINLAERRKQDLLAEETRHNTVAATQVGNVAEQTGLGQERANAANFPAELQRKLDQMSKTGPIQSAQAGDVANAQFWGTHGPDEIAAGAQKVGADSAAQHEAALPFEMKLAQARANTQLLNQQAMDDYKKAHPALTAQQLNRASSAQSANAMIDSEVRPLLDEMDKRGMLGPLQSRAADLAADKIKAEDLFPNAEDAKLAARFFSSVKLVTSLAANTHGGTRAVAGKDSMQYWKTILSGVGDKSIIEGQLGAVHKIMDIYLKDPSLPEMFPIPGVTQQVGPQQDPLASAQDKLRRLLGGQ